MDGQQFCLKWDGFQGSVTSVFDHLRQDSELVDVTLCCEGRQVQAHRMMLSACSPYFRELFKVKHTLWGCLLLARLTNLWNIAKIAKKLGSWILGLEIETGSSSMIEIYLQN